MTTQPRMTIPERVARLRALTPDEAYQLLVLIDARTPKAVDAAIEYAEAAATLPPQPADVTGPEPVTGTCGASDNGWPCSLDADHDSDFHEAGDTDGIIQHEWPRFQGPAGPAAGDAADPGPAEKCGAEDGDSTICVLPAGHDGPHADECDATDGKHGSWCCSLPSGHPGHHMVTTDGGEILHHWPRASRSHLSVAGGAL